MVDEPLANPPTAGVVISRKIEIHARVLPGGTRSAEVGRYRHAMPSKVTDTSEARELFAEPGYERYVPSRHRWWRRRSHDGLGTPDDVPARARGWRTLARPARGDGPPLDLESVPCDLCGPTKVEPVAVGEDFEYWTSPDSFLGVRCLECRLVYLDPRPSIEELDRIYPSTYHAFDFSAERFGLVYRVRERLEARRILKWAGDLGNGARILDVGCGDGFHLDLFARFGDPAWIVEGVEPDTRAADVARAKGLTVHGTTLQDAEITDGTIDLALLVQTIEHVPDPVELLTLIGRKLRPGGRLVVVTDNVGSPDFRIFGSRHWGGWHFPRHWHLYDRDTLGRTATRAGLEIDAIETMLSPVNWVYSVRNLLVDLRAPKAISRHLSLEGSAGLAIGTMVDGVMTLAGRGALLRGSFRRSADPTD